MARRGRGRGRYANLWGDFWRHPKVQDLPLSSVGALAKLWSRAADKGMREGDVLSRRDVDAVFAGNARNRSRVLKPLADAGFVTSLDGGALKLVGWGDNNPIAANDVADDVTDADAHADADGDAYADAYGDAYGDAYAVQTPQQNQALSPPLLSPKSQVPLTPPLPPRGDGGSVPEPRAVESPGLWERYDPARRSEYLAELWAAWGAGHPSPGWAQQDALACKLQGWLAHADEPTRARAFAALKAWTRRDYAPKDKIRDLLSGDWSSIEVARESYRDPYAGLLQVDHG